MELNMKILKGALVAAGVGAVMAVLGAAPASAAAIAVTWDPTQSNPALGGTSFTADNFNIQDYATIDLSNPGAVVETAILPVLTYQLNNGATNSTTGYKLYFTVVATSNLTSFTPGPDGNLKGHFTSLTYTLWGDAGGNATFVVPTTQGNALSGLVNGSGDTQVDLASGSFDATGFNKVEIDFDGTSLADSTAVSPSASVFATIMKDGGAGGFFVDPSILAGLDFTAAFTNVTTAVTYNNATQIVTITGGGGQVQVVAVPEPVTLSLFGAGLAGAAFARRRKSKKA
jgi:hypothetical protein